MLISRREYIKSGAFALTTPFYSTESAAQSSRPFCEFSMTNGWNASQAREYVTREARVNDVSGVPQIVAQICRNFNLNPNFRILITRDEDNAYATVAGGRKILGIDVDFLRRLNSQVGTQWSAIQVIAHEIGHHISGFGEDSHRSELNADYWSGQSLARLGSSKNSARAAILAIGSERDTRSHPNKYTRAETIAKGWDDAKRDFIDRSFCISC